MILALDKLVMALPGRTVGPLSAGLGPGVHHLAGGNGSGKTTLLRILCAEMAPTSGRVLLDGDSPAQSSRTRRRVSFLPAVPELPGFLTVEEGWRMLAALRGAPAWDGAALTGQLGLEPARRLDTLSVGQRRKAELVAALAGDPDVLLLDEVFAPLDTRSVLRVAELFDRARSTKILLLTGHGALPLAADQVLSL